MHLYILRSGIPGSSFAEKDLGPLVGIKLNNQQFTFTEKKGCYPRLHNLGVLTAG